MAGKYYDEDGTVTKVLLPLHKKRDIGNDVQGNIRSLCRNPQLIRSRSARCAGNGTGNHRIGHGEDAGVILLFAVSHRQTLRQICDRDVNILMGAQNAGNNLTFVHDTCFGAGQRERIDRGSTSYSGRSVDRFLPVIYHDKESNYSQEYHKHDKENFSHAYGVYRTETILAGFLFLNRVQ